MVPTVTRRPASRLGFLLALVCAAAMALGGSAVQARGWHGGWMGHGPAGRAGGFTHTFSGRGYPYAGGWVAHRAGFARGWGYGFRGRPGSWAAATVWRPYWRWHRGGSWRGGFVIGGAVGVFAPVVLAPPPIVIYPPPIVPAIAVYPPPIVVAPAPVLAAPPPLVVGPAPALAAPSAFAAVPAPLPILPPWPLFAAAILPPIVVLPPPAVVFAAAVPPVIFAPLFLTPRPWVVAVARPAAAFHAVDVGVAVHRGAGAGRFAIANTSHATWNARGWSHAGRGGGRAAWGGSGWERDRQGWGVGRAVAEAPSPGWRGRGGTGWIGGRGRGR
jgi:hypothetical protein